MAHVVRHSYWEVRTRNKQWLRKIAYIPNIQPPLTDGAVEQVALDRTRFGRPIKVDLLYLYDFRAKLRVYRITIGDSD